MQSRKHYLAAALVTLAALGASACSDEDDEPASFTATLNSQGQGSGGSTATGSASFNFDGNSTVQYTVNVTGLTGATSARIHSGSSGETGQARVDLTLADGVAGGGTGNGGGTGGNGGTGDPGTAFSGELARSSFTESDVQGISFEDLIEEMRDGRAYVVVNTSANPSGEIRGQIRRVE